MTARDVHRTDALRRCFLWLGLVLFGGLVFLLSFGSLAVEHRLQKEFRTAVASLPVADHGTPEIGLFPPRVTLDRLTLRGPHGVLALKDICLDVKPLDSAAVIRCLAAGGRFEAVLHADDWGRGAWNVSWKAENAALKELLSPWAVLESPVALLGGRVSMEGRYAVPGRRDIVRPWMGNGRVQCTLEDGAVRHVLPVLTKLELSGISGRMAVDWNKKRVTVREAALRQKYVSLDVSGGMNLVPGKWHRSELQLEASVKAEAGLLNEKLLPERVTRQAGEGLRLRLSGTPEKPKLEF